MPDIDELFEQACKLLGDDLDRFLEGLTDKQRGEIQERLAATIVPDPYGTIEGESDKAIPQFTPPPKKQQRQSGSGPPRSIGPYKILQAIGKGGMGQVFMAEQHEPVKRRVALKIINTETPTEKVLARFEAERQALAMMDHQNIARVLDAGRTADGRPYFAMELVKGLPITEYCDTNRLTTNDRLELFVQACRAIQHAHQKGVIHRDLNPSNILVTLYDGKPVAKVIDFGLAKAIHDQLQLTEKTLFTQYGQVVGTLEYMSPEQAELNALDIDTRTDVYSLGVILYELLTGSTPVGRTRLRSEAFDHILALIRNEEAPRPSQRLSDSGDAISTISKQRKTDPRKLSLILRGDLDWIAIKALEKDRSRRYDGPAALSDDVERYLNHDPVAASPPSPRYRLKKAYSKHRVAFFAVCTVTVSLIAGITGTATMSFWAYRLASDNERKANEAIAATVRADKKTEEAEAARSAAEQQREETQRALAQMYSAEGLRLADEQDRPSALAWLAKALQTASTERKWDASLRLQSVLNQTPSMFRIVPHKERVDGCDLSPSEELLATGSNDGTAVVLDLESGNTVAVLNHPGSVKLVKFHDNPKALLTASNETVRLWDLSGPTVTRSFEHAKPVRDLATSMDGERLLTSTRDGSLFVWDMATGEVLWRRIAEGELSKGSFHSAGELAIVFDSLKGQLECWDTKQQKLAGNLGEHTEGIKALAVAAVAPVAATIDDRGDVRIWDLESQSSTVERKAPNASRLQLSADGQHIAFISGGSWFDPAGVVVWDVSLPDEPRESSFPHPSLVTSIVFHAQNNWMITTATDEAVRVWDLDSGNLVHLLHHRGYAMRATIDQPGHYLAVAGGIADSGHVVVWNLETCRPLAFEFVGTRGAAFSRDGEHVATFDETGQVQVWDSKNAQLVSTLQHHHPVTEVDFTTDDGVLLAGTTGGAVVRWNWIAEERLEEWKVGGSSVVWSKSTPSSSPTLAGLVQEESTVTVLRAGHATDSNLKLLANLADIDIAVSPSGRLVAAKGLMSTLRIWNSPFSDPPLELEHPHPVRVLGDVDFNNGESQVAVGTGEWTGAGRIQVWSVLTGERLGEPFPTSGYVSDVEFSPDGKFIAAASRDQSARVWRVDSSRALLAELPHNAAVSKVRFFKNGLSLMTIAGNSVCLWSVETGRRLAQIKVDSAVMHAEPSPSEDTVLVVTESGEASLWRLADRRAELSQLILQAELVSGRGIDDNGSTQTWTPDELYDRWQVMQHTSR